ncbi:hypothetical protein CHS0354_032077 [Potamilus streckersoni]|uniref:tRNA wybutosine-synthesizing protein 3 homolog n=1 Tax=Potamilus streckersoni TaxID=2493646 RepID=A0AAE0WEM2_9BIVA|nr:hypothetical protein CHS0354_032077 [Potamilus streckersoni]
MNFHNLHHFDEQKKKCLSAADLSRKGSVDAHIIHLVQFINDHPDLFSTSSCSGRIILLDNSDIDETSIKKKGCQWIFTSHDLVESKEVIGSLKSVNGNAVFKFEPFVLHAQCRNLTDAQTLLSCALSAGFRNSGISIGNKGKFITAVRSTHSLEVPLTCDGKLMVSEEYIEYLVKLANIKMKENFQRIERLFTNMKETLTGKNFDRRKKKHKEKSHIKRTVSFEKIQPRENEKETEVEVSVEEDLSVCNLFQSDFVT